MSLITATREEIAWAAGLFEGEGSICIKPQTIQLQLGMTDKDVIEKFWLLLGLGKVYGPYKRKQEHHKPMFVWSVSGQQRCQAILAAFWSFLGVRRQGKARDAIIFGASLEPHGGVKRRCKRGHEFSEENTYTWNGHRTCIACSVSNQKRFRNNNREILAARQRAYMRKKKLETST